MDVILDFVHASKIRWFLERALHGSGLEQAYDDCLVQKSDVCFAGARVTEVLVASVTVSQCGPCVEANGGTCGEMIENANC